MSPHEEIEAALDEYQTRSRAASATGAQAFARLLRLAEERNSGQITRVVRFVAATYNGQAFPLDLFELRAVTDALGLGIVRLLAAGREPLDRECRNGDQRENQQADRQQAFL